MLNKGNKHVTVVEMIGKLGKDIGASTRWGMMSDIKRLNVTLMKHTKAVRIRPDVPGSDANLGVALTNLGRYEEAVARFSEALRIDPDFTEARETRELVLQKMKKSNGASNK